MTPKDVVKAFHSAFVARDVNALCALYADDAVNHQVAEEPLRGKAAIRKGFEEFFRAFPDDYWDKLTFLRAHGLPVPRDAG